MNLFKNQAITAIVKIIVAILLGLFVLMVGAFIMSFDGLPQIIRFNHTTMLVLSFLVILVLSKGRISTYGFKLISTFLEGFSFPQIVIFGWTYASICEEVFTRWLIQSYLSPLTKYGLTLCKARVSLPVLIGIYLFGHFSFSKSSLMQPVSDDSSTIPRRPP